MDPEWCKLSDMGLPSPDLIFYLDATPSEYLERADYGNELYELVEQQVSEREGCGTAFFPNGQFLFQRLIRDEFTKLQDDRWNVIRTAFKHTEACTAEMINVIFEEIETRSPLVPLKRLWEI